MHLFGNLVCPSWKHRRRLALIAFLCFLVASLLIIPTMGALDYDTDVAFWNALDSTSGWVISQPENLTLTLENETLMYGSYSLNFTWNTLNAMGNGDQNATFAMSYSYNFTGGNMTGAFWFNCVHNLGGTSTILFIDASGYYMGVQYYASAMTMILNTPVGGGYVSTPFAISLNTWYWIEVLMETGGTYRLFTNGTNKKTHVTDTIGDLTDFVVIARDGVTFGKSHIIDFVRLANNREFPPTYPPPPPEEPYNYLDEYLGMGIFLGGIIMMIYAPSWVAWKIKKSGVDADTVERVGYAMLIFIVGLGLFLTYIYG